MARDIRDRYWFFGVYFLRCAATGLVKIGFTTKHPEWRRQQLRRYSPSDLEGLGVISGPLSLEKVIHRRFREQRAHHEWFRPEGLLSDFLATGIDPWPLGRRDPDGPWTMTSAMVDLRSSIENEAKAEEEFSSGAWRRTICGPPTRRHLKSGRSGGGDGARA